MSCAACSARVKKAVSEVKGVTACNVNLLTNSMTVEGAAQPEDIISAVKKAGYKAEPAVQKGGKNKAGEASLSSFSVRVGALKIRFLWSLLFVSAIMYISMLKDMLGLPLPQVFESRAVTGLTELLLTATVMVINGEFFINGLKGALHLAPNMDTLVALGAFSSFAYSTAVLYKTLTLPGYQGEFFFESAAMILTLITLG